MKIGFRREACLLADLVSIINKVAISLHRYKGVIGKQCQVYNRFLVRHLAVLRMPWSNDQAGIL